MTTQPAVPPQGPRIGPVTFSIREAVQTPASRERYERRAEVLAAWLYAEWKHEQARAQVCTPRHVPLN